MAKTTVTLFKGLTIGEEKHVEAEIREATAGDILDAMEESEKVVMTPGRDRQEPALVPSPTLVGAHTLRRQIVRIGTYQGPLSLAELKRLHPLDLDLLQKAADTLEAAGLSGVIDRGRIDRGERPGDAA